MLAKVHYLPKQDRIAWIQALFRRAADIIRSNSVPDDKLGRCAFYIFQRLKAFAIYTKHDGYREENEWRIVYMRDYQESERLNHMIGYCNGRNGPEPKLKFRLEPVEGVPETSNLSVSTLTDRIILGPLTPTYGVITFAIAIETLGYPHLKDRIKRSGIPYRG
jgi:hypothetical protein